MDLSDHGRRPYPNQVNIAKTLLDQSNFIKLFKCKTKIHLDQLEWCVGEAAHLGGIFNRPFSTSYETNHVNIFKLKPI